MKWFSLTSLEWKRIVRHITSRNLTHIFQTLSDLRQECPKLSWNISFGNLQAFLEFPRKASSRGKIYDFDDEFLVVLSVVTEIE
jgi:hypothetical protein